jgi:hypothetical protein
LTKPEEASLQGKSLKPEVMIWKSKGSYQKRLEAHYRHAQETEKNQDSWTMHK